jgi:hypothetical protein
MIVIVAVVEALFASRRGQRKYPEELIGKLQSIPGVHKVMNNQLWDRSYTEKELNNPVASEAIRKGVTLFERQNTSSGENL